MWGIRRLRFATGVDDDLRPFHDAFRDDPVIGKAVRSAPSCASGARRCRGRRCSDAVSEQLIEFERAVAIQRRMIAAPRRPLRADRACATLPAPAAVAGAGAGASSRRWTSPRPARSRCAAPPPRSRPAASTCSRPTRCPAGAGCGRSRAIGPWTLEMLAASRPGRTTTASPAGDLGFLKLVGRITTGNPQAPAPTRTRCARSSSPSASGRALAGEYLRARRGRPLPVSPAESVPRVEPLAGQELVRQRLLGDLPLA